MAKSVKKLYRSREDRVIAGICGGLGQYFSVDSVLIRIAWIVATLISFGTGVLLYLLMIFIVPLEPITKKSKTIKSE